MTKYHISETTGRPNKCTATKRVCPIAGEHFDTKADAHSYIEKKASESHETFKSLKKPSKRNTSALTEEELTITERNKRFTSLMDFSPSIFTSKDIQERICSGLREYAVREKPGCRGCQGDYDDYCRCEIYTGEIEVSHYEMAANFYRNLSKSQKYSITLDSEEWKVVKDIEDIFQKHSIDDLSNYEVESESGYYGDELDYISVRDSNRFEQLHKELTEIFKDSNN